MSVQNPINSSLRNHKGKGVERRTKAVPHAGDERGCQLRWPLLVVL
jgi:hypothetical protein